MGRCFWEVACGTELFIPETPDDSSGEPPLYKVGKSGRWCNVYDRDLISCGYYVCIYVLLLFLNGVLKCGHQVSKKDLRGL